MNTDILKRILKPTEPSRRFCTVKTVLSNTRYRVYDDQNRLFTIDGDKGYLPGNKIIMQNNRITGFGARKAVSKTFSV